MRHLFATFVALLVIASLVGCTKHKPMQVYMGYDTSGGARSNLGAYILVTTALAQQMRAGEDKLTLYRVDCNTREFSDQSYDGDSEKLLKTLAREVKSPAPQNGTYPYKFWKQVVERATQSKLPVVVVLFSDGDNDDIRPEAIQEMSVTAQKLAACPQVERVAICGAEPANWSSLRQIFAPMGERLSIISPSEMTAENASLMLQVRR